MRQVTIGFVPRDRFCKAAESLQRIFDHTDIPFTLVVVDCNIPERFRQPIQAVLEGRDNVRIIRTDRYLLSNEAHNLILRETEDEFLCLIENDILVEDKWLSHLIAACEEHPADVAVPILIERQEGFEKIHFDDRLGYIESVASPSGPKLEIRLRSTSKEYDLTASRMTIGMMETHCMLCRTEVLQRTGPFDESLSTRAEVDFSLALHHVGARIVCEPMSRVIYSPPPPVYPEERDYYFFKWDLERAVENHDHLIAKWNLVNLPTSTDFVRMRRALASEMDPEAQLRHEIAHRAMLDAAAQELAALIPAGDTLVLVDDTNWKANEVCKGRRVIPFLERDGQYWGAPPDDDTAISELERLRQSGAGFVVFASPAFWWLDHYAGFRDYLHSRFRLLADSERVVVFDLQVGRL
ncbi:MAG: glycosyltransferase [Actinomycetota bacterium]|nr:glycosyltransferase [Actinomycetota bacterium]